MGIFKAIPLLLVLTGCFAHTNSSSCPPFPEAGPEVAEELETIPYDGYEHTWGWLNKVYKLKGQLDECRK